MIRPERAGVGFQPLRRPRDRQGRHEQAFTVEHGCGQGGEADFAFANGFRPALVPGLVDVLQGEAGIFRHDGGLEGGGGVGQKYFRGRPGGQRQPGAGGHRVLQATGRLLGCDTHPVGARQLVELDRFTRIGHKGRHDGGCGVDKRRGAACPQGREYRTNGPPAICGACEDMVGF